MSLSELEKEVRNLSAGEFSAFTRWLDEYAARRWDEQFEQDVAAGKLDKLGEKADAVFEAGECSELRGTSLLPSVATVGFLPAFMIS